MSMKRKIHNLLHKSDAHKKDAVAPLLGEPNSEPLRAPERPRSDMPASKEIAGETSLPERGQAMSVTWNRGNTPRTDSELERGDAMAPPITATYSPPTFDSNSSATERGGSVMGSVASQTMSLGGDSRAMTNASARKHAEDIANRNIELRNSGKDTSLAADTLSETNAELDESPPSAYMSNPNRKSWPARVARNEGRINYRRRRSSQDSTDDTASHPEDYGPRIETPRGRMNPTARTGTDGANTSQSAEVHLQNELVRGALGGIVDLRDSEDFDRTIQHAPAVTHETIKPTTHEHIEQKIYRDIHTHDVYHRIQPIIETEVLPARHFIPNPDPKARDSLIEVSEAQLPNCTGANQRWFIAKKEETIPENNAFFPTMQARLTEPKVVDEKTYITPDGVERKESLIIHPSTVEDPKDHAGREYREIEVGLG